MYKKYITYFKNINKYKRQSKKHKKHKSPLK